MLFKQRLKKKGRCQTPGCDGGDRGLQTRSGPSSGGAGCGRQGSRAPALPRTSASGLNSGRCDRVPSRERVTQGGLGPGDQRGFSIPGPRPKLGPGSCRTPPHPPPRHSELWFPRSPPAAQPPAWRPNLSPQTARQGQSVIFQL